MNIRKVKSPKVIGLTSECRKSWIVSAHSTSDLFSVGQTVFCAYACKFGLVLQWQHKWLISSSKVVAE